MSPFSNISSAVSKGFSMTGDISIDRKLELNAYKRIPPKMDQMSIKYVDENPLVMLIGMITATGILSYNT